MINQKCKTHFTLFQEIQKHVDELKAKYGSFEYAEKLSAFDIEKFSEFTRQMLPTFNLELNTENSMLKDESRGETSNDDTDDEDSTDGSVKETEEGQQISQKRSSDALTNPVPTKIMRTSTEDNVNGHTLDEKWYKSKEAELKEDLNHVLLKFSANNLTSLNTIRTIKNEMAIVKNENIDLKAKVEELQQEVAAGKMKIAALEGSGKKCTHCNKPMDTPLYCDKNCHDSRMQLLVLQLQQTHSK